MIKGRTERNKSYKLLMMFLNELELKKYNCFSDFVLLYKESQCTRLDHSLLPLNAMRVRVGFKQTASLSLIYYVLISHTEGLGSV